MKSISRRTQGPAGKVSVLAFALALALGLARCSELPVQTEVASPEVAEADQLRLPTPPVRCAEGVLASGALWRVCVPLLWNGSAVVYAPGYLSVYEELRLRDDELGGTSVQDLATRLGFVYATTSYHKNGLVLPQALADLQALVGIAEHLTPRPLRHVYLVGPSNGGLVTAKAMELAPQTFHGGLAACGPYGSFVGQMNYFGDFRVVFDYFFTEEVRGWSRWTQPPGTVDERLVANWGRLERRIENAVARNPLKTFQLLNVTRAPIDPANRLATAQQTTVGILWYHVFGTNDAIAVLGGMPFHNADRVYTGSFNDHALNAGVERFVGDPRAFAFMQAHYETSGHHERPVVTLHTTGDPIVPVWHQLLYYQKASPRHLQTPITIPRYGHCNFTTAEVLAAFAVLVLKVSGQNLEVPAAVLPEREAQEEFLLRAREHGANPQLVR